MNINEIEIHPSELELEQPNAEVFHADLKSTIVDETKIMHE